MKEASQAQPQLQAIAAWQKEKRRKKRISRSAEREEGFAPSTAQTFEKV